jgi:hypothetical protein
VEQKSRLHKIQQKSAWLQADVMNSVRQKRRTHLRQHNVCAQAAQKAENAFFRPLLKPLDFFC